MFETFYPGNYVDSAYEIPYEKLYERGYRGIIFDVDNTLVPHGAPADAQAIELFERLRRIGFSTCILSNNKEPRVSPFADKVGSPYIFKGGKPSRKGYERAMDRMKTDRDTTFFVGDQLLTDVLGAKVAGHPVVFVESLGGKEHFITRCTRKLEKFFLNRLHSNNMMPKERVL